MPSNLDTVRALWEAFDRDGVDAMLAHVDPDVEWWPSSAGGRVLRGGEALREHYRTLASAGVELHVRVDGMEEVGSIVLVRGSLRVERCGSLSESTMVWAYVLRDGRVRRARAFHSRGEALAAIAAS